MNNMIKTTALALALTAAGATGALAGKSTTPNTTVPSTIVAVNVAALSAAMFGANSIRRIESLTTTDGLRYTITLNDGQTAFMSSEAIANFLAGYR